MGPPCYIGAALVRVLALLISACLYAAAAGAQRADDILVRAGTFVRDTAQRLSGVVADELYEQQLFASFVDSRLTPRIARRAMRSEALFMWLPAANQWVFVRNVLAVD